MWFFGAATCFVRISVMVLVGRPKSFATSWTLYFSIPNQNTSLCSNPGAGKFLIRHSAVIRPKPDAAAQSSRLRKEPLPFFTGWLWA